MCTNRRSVSRPREPVVVGPSSEQPGSEDDEAEATEAQPETQPKAKSGRADSSASDPTAAAFVPSSPPPPLPQQIQHEHRSPPIHQQSSHQPRSPPATQQHRSTPLHRTPSISSSHLLSSSPGRLVYAARSGAVAVLDEPIDSLLARLDDEANLSDDSGADMGGVHEEDAPPPAGFEWLPPDVEVEVEWIGRIGGEGWEGSAVEGVDMSAAGAVRLPYRIRVDSGEEVAEGEEGVSPSG